MFLPGQFTTYFEVARQAESIGTSGSPNVFFAGEHLSRHHTWIAGALESSLYSVRGLLEEEVLPLRQREGAGIPLDFATNDQLVHALTNLLNVVDEPSIAKVAPQAANFAVDLSMANTAVVSAVA